MSNHQNPTGLILKQMRKSAENSERSLLISPHSTAHSVVKTIPVHRALPLLVPTTQLCKTKIMQFGGHRVSAVDSTGTTGFDPCHCRQSPKHQQEWSHSSALGIKPEHRWGWSPNPNPNQTKLPPPPPKKKRNAILSKVSKLVNSRIPETQLEFQRWKA